MIKTPPTFARLAVMVLFALSSFSGLLYLWIAFGGAVPFKPAGYRVHVAFPEATQLVSQADVRISGVPVGKVVAVEPGPRNRTLATLELRTPHAPVARDTRAVLRLKTLLGETFVELSPGHPERGTVPEGGTLPDSAVSPTVELDEVLRTFDRRTREGFQDWMQSSALAMEGRGADVNAAFGQLPGFVEANRDLFATLDSQSAAVRRLIADTGEVFSAISSREGDLAGMATELDRLFGTTGARNRELAQIFRELPRLERESVATLPRLTRLAREAEPVVRTLQPAATEMQPAFAALERLSPEFEGFFAQLSPVVSASERGLPALEGVLADLPPLFGRLQPFLRNVNPMFEHLGRHRRELTGFFANVTAASLARDLNLPGSEEPVHSLRTAQTLSPEALAFLPQPTGASRQNAYPAPGGLDELAAGLSVLNARPCANGDPAPPESAIPETLTALVQAYVYRGAGRDVARPPCRAQTLVATFPQLRAEP